MNSLPEPLFISVSEQVFLSIDMRTQNLNFKNPLNSLIQIVYKLLSLVVKESL